MNKVQFEQLITFSSIPIRQLGVALTPEAFASCCLVSYTQKLLVLTVEHATGNQKNWAIEMEYVPEKGTKLYQIGPMRFLKVFNIKTASARTIDFSYALIKEQVLPLHQWLDPKSGNIMSRPKIILKCDFSVVPANDREYGFFGQTRFDLDGSDLKFASTLEMQMKYIDEKDDLSVFNLTHKYGSHPLYQGCSGAPILDDLGNLVALVAEGDAQNDAILGLTLAKYKTPIDIECANVK
jgi:hypothetical protein